MQVIKDLTEVYSDHVKLPLFLVNDLGEIEHSVSSNHFSTADQLSRDKLLELKYVAFQITKPIIVTVDSSIYDFVQYSYCIVTPMIKVKEKNMFLITGFFKRASSDSLLLNESPSSLFVFNEEEIECCIRKVNNLYLLLEKKVNVENRQSILDHFNSILHIIDEIDDNNKDYAQSIYRILDKLVEAKVFDFLGVAMKDEDEVLVVKYICGESKVNVLNGKRFYLGEGLIGKAVILGEDFNWSKGVDIDREEFLNRYGIYPNHLFGFTCKQKNAVQGVFFGGSFRKESLSEDLIELLKIVIQLVTKKLYTNKKVANLAHNQAICVNYFDLIDISLSLKNKKQLLYKILDLCQTLNKGAFSCFTSSNDEFVHRGVYKINGFMVHHEKLRSLEKNTRSLMLIENEYIHFTVHFDSINYGLFTTEFIKEEDLKRATVILSSINKLITSEDQQSQYELIHSQDQKFNMLYDSMKEMNRDRFAASEFGLHLASLIIPNIQVLKQKEQVLINVCKVMTYSYKILNSYFVGTEEWGYLQELFHLVNGGHINTELSIELELLSFIYNIVVHKELVVALAFVKDRDLYRLCLSTYEMAYNAHIKANLHLEVNLELEAQSREIEQKVVNDLKSVISRFKLTSREQEVLYLVLEGMNNQEVGSYLNISIHTVKNHATNIYKKLNVSDRIQAMSKVYRYKYDVNDEVVNTKSRNLQRQIRQFI